MELSQSKQQSWLDKNQKLVTFIVVTVLFLILHYVENLQTFYWDSEQYWNLSTAKVLFDFPNIIRGYFFPALLFPARFFSDLMPALGYAPFRIISSIVYSYFFSNLLPEFYISVFGGRINFWRRLIVPTLVVLLFPGLIIFPLSDLPAVILMIGAIVCTINSANTSKTRFKCYFTLILGGILAYGAYNTRTIYLFPVIMLFFLGIIIIYRNYPRRTKLVAMSIFFLGMALAAIPQCIINQKNHGFFLPVVVAHVSDRTLFTTQLFLGITLQRFETSIDKSLFPKAAVFYLDNSGKNLFNENKIHGSEFWMPHYFALVLKNPIEFLGIYGRHFVNGLDLRDGEVYTSVQSSQKNILAFFNFLVVFLGLAIILLAVSASRPTRKKRMESTFCAFVILLPVLAIIPAAIETRFFLALHLAIYSAIAFSSDIDVMTKFFRKHWGLIALLFGICASVFFAVSTNTMSNVTPEYPDVYRGMPYEAHSNTTLRNILVRMFLPNYNEAKDSKMIKH